MQEHSGTISKANRKSGAIIGGAACLGIALALMYVSLWLFWIYVPLLIAAFVLAIAAIIQRRLLLGLGLLLATLVVPTVLALVVLPGRIGDATSSLAAAVDATRPDSRPDEVSPNNSSIGQTKAAQNAPAARPDQTPEAVLKTFDAPPQFNSATAIQVAVGEQADVGVPGWTPTLSFSHDGKYLVYAPALSLWGSAKGTKYPMTIKDARTLSTVKVLDVGDFLVDRLKNSTMGGIESTAWSPDGKRILFTNGDYLAIVEIDTGKVFDLPASCPFFARGTTIVWRSPTVVHFFDGPYSVSGDINRYATALDLDTLKLSKPSKDDASESFKGVAHHANIVLREGTRNEGGGFVVEDKAYCRTLFTGIPGGQDTQRQWIPSPDLTRIYFQKGSDIRMICLTTREAPPTRFSMRFSSGGTLTTAKKDEFVALLKKGDLVWAKVYAAEVNPLNGLVLGPKLNSSVNGPGLQDFKGWVLVRAFLEDDHLQVDALHERQPIASGDVIWEIGGSSAWGVLDKVVDAPGSSQPEPNSP